LSFLEGTRRNIRPDWHLTPLRTNADNYAPVRADPGWLCFVCTDLGFGIHDGFHAIALYVWMASVENMDVPKRIGPTPVCDGVGQGRDSYVPQKTSFGMV